MQNYIASANLNVLNGILHGTMEFAPGLNIISGENGTLKTQLLQSLRAGGALFSIVLSRNAGTTRGYMSA